MKNTASITIGILTVLLIGLFCQAAYLIKQNDVLANKLASAEFLLQQIPTIEEFQIRIGAEPDGIVGPNTLEKWDAALCNQGYLESLRLMEPK